jgi:hypothetical protein
MKKIVIKQLTNSEIIVYYRHNKVNVHATIAKDKKEVNNIVNEYLSTYFDDEEYKLSDVIEKEFTNPHPLILVFYLDRELMANNEIIGTFAESVNRMLHDKQSNVLAFFLPTDTTERVECINPVIVSEPDMERINGIIQDIKTSFSIDSNQKLES